MVSRLKDLYRHFKFTNISNCQTQESPLLCLKKKQNSEDFTNVISNTCKQIAKKTWTRNHNFEEK